MHFLKEINSFKGNLTVLKRNLFVGNVHEFSEKWVFVRKTGIFGVSRVLRRVPKDILTRFYKEFICGKSGKNDKFSENLIKNVVFVRKK
jgi:hypothetical protein